MNDELPLTLIVVEDSDEDYASLCRSLRKFDVPHAIIRCKDGQECLAYLNTLGKLPLRRDAPFPALILLDLNMPRMDGHQLLRHIKASDTFRHLPIIVLSASTSPEDVNTCYAAGASSYLVKNVDYSAYEQTIQRFVDYWFHAVRLPFLDEAQ